MLLGKYLSKKLGSRALSAFHVFFLCAYFLLSLVQTPPAHAILAIPAGVTPELLNQLKSMPQDQQRRLAMQYGIDLEALGEPDENILESNIGAVGEPIRQQIPLTPEQMPDALTSEEDEDPRIFGRNLFSQSVSTFAPTDNAPVPSDYVLGPGDQLIVQLFGTENQTLNLAVSRTGEVNFPRLGPITVAGLTYSDARTLILRRVAEQLVGVEAVLSMGNLRAINIFIAGETTTPGAYSVSALTTVSQALFVAGGVSELGSLRNIQIKRSGKTIATFDLYDLLTRGDASNDIRLFSGDVVFIPTYESFVTIYGAVKRPMIYEMKSGETMSDLLRFSGGTEAGAYLSAISIQRLESDGELPIVLTSNHKTTSGKSLKLRSGDKVLVPSASTYFENSIELEGAVIRPGTTAWKPGLRVSDIIGSARSSLKPEADLGYSLIVRTINDRLDIEVLQFSLSAVLLEPNGPEDFELQIRDRILIFNYPLATIDEKVSASETYEVEDDVDNKDASKLSARQKLLAPVIEKLRLQATSGDEVKLVSVSGAVKAPGEYPLTRGLTVEGLIRAGGGLHDYSYLEAAELRRVKVKSGSKVQSIYKEIDLREDQAQTNLSSRDHITVRAIPNWQPNNAVEVLGEVKFPGEYLIRKGERLSDIIERAGGLTENAFAKGAVFTREAIREQEILRAKELANDIQRTMASSYMTQEENKFLDLGSLAGFTEQLRLVEGDGRLLIDLERAIAGRVDSDIELLDGDKVSIPERTATLSVIGEVRRASSYSYKEEYEIDDYLTLSAGLTLRADADNIYIVRADGSVFRPEKNFFSFLGNSALQAGDTIVVPINSAYKEQLPFWRDLTQIIYQGAVSIAAVLAL
jgi:polysaccharide export outer membrane protein